MPVPLPNGEERIVHSVDPRDDQDGKKSSTQRHELAYGGLRRVARLGECP